MIAYNPLTALGIRIGSPEQNDFLGEHAEMLTAEFGGSFVPDMRLALNGDLPAAWRVADVLAPAAVFNFDKAQRGYVAVSYTCFDIDGRMEMRAIPPVVVSQAMVLVCAAITVHSKVRRGADVQVA